MKNHALINTIIFFITALLFTSIGVAAGTLISSSNVAYDNRTSGINSTNVQEALDTLYIKTKTGNATSSQILINATALVNGSIVTGTMPNNEAWTITPTTSGKVTIPEGYHNGLGYVDTSIIVGSTIDLSKISVVTTSYGTFTSTYDGYLYALGEESNIRGVYMRNNTTGETYGIDGPWDGTYTKGKIYCNVGDSIYVNGNGNRLFFFYRK